MPTRNVNLTDHFDKFITRVVAAGDYGNASEVVREGLRLVEQRRKEEREKLRWLREAAAVGLRELENGQGITVRSREELRSLIRSAVNDADA